MFTIKNSVLKLTIIDQKHEREMMTPNEVNKLNIDIANIEIQLREIALLYLSEEEFEQGIEPSYSDEDAEAVEQLITKLDRLQEELDTGTEFDL